MSKAFRHERNLLSHNQYADNEDARQYDRRLRGRVDERRELAINPQTGMSQRPVILPSLDQKVSRITLLRRTLASRRLQVWSAICLAEASNLAGNMLVARTRQIYTRHYACWEQDVIALKVSQGVRYVSDM